MSPETFFTQTVDVAAQNLEAVPGEAFRPGPTFDVAGALVVDGSGNPVYGPMAYAAVPARVEVLQADVEGAVGPTHRIFILPQYGPVRKGDVVTYEGRTLVAAVVQERRAFASIPSYLVLYCEGYIVG